MHTAYRVIARSLRGGEPRSMLRAEKLEDLLKSSTLGLVPRYEMSRGIEGDYIVDLSNLRGIKEEGEWLEVMAGTPWREVINYSPELYGNMDFSVGGSVFFNDPVFGLNEFSGIRRRVRVKAVKEGTEVEGEYVDGLIYSVRIRREVRKVVTKVLMGTLEDLGKRVNSLYAGGVPVFRDVSLVKSEGKWTLYVSYPESRERLVSAFVDEMSEAEPFLESLGISHRFRFYGKAERVKAMGSFQKLDSYDSVVLRFSKAEVYASVYSTTFTPLPAEFVLFPYSDTSTSQEFVDCVFCGRCIDVCPHGFQRNSPSYTPFGFFVSKSPELANCHLCGLCEKVCPVNIDIVSQLRRAGRFEVNLPPPPDLALKRQTVALITPLSYSLGDYTVKALKLLKFKGLHCGVVTVDVNYGSFLRGDVDYRLVADRLKDVDEVITLTPEDYKFMIPVKRLITADVVPIDLLFKDEIQGKRIHIGCMAQDYWGQEGDRTCSTEFLNLVNGEGVKISNRKEIADLSLCPLSARRLGIMNLAEALGVSLKEELEEVRNFVKGLLSSYESMKDLIFDLSWYQGLSEELYTNGLISLIIGEAKLSETALLLAIMGQVEVPGELKSLWPLVISQLSKRISNSA